MKNLGIWTNRLYNGGEVDNWRNRVIVSSLSDLNEWVERFEYNVKNGEVLHIHDEWNNENITEKALEVVYEYRRLLHLIECEEEKLS